MRTVGVGPRSDAAAVIQQRERGQSGDAFQAQLAPPVVLPSVRISDVNRLSAIDIARLTEGDLEDRTANRRRAVRLGNGMLALLSLLRDAEVDRGTFSSDVLDRLAACLDEAGPPAEGELGGILQAIETRVQVELARRGR